jgi:AcrR family transcriptional regulator
MKINRISPVDSSSARIVNLLSLSTRRPSVLNSARRDMGKRQSVPSRRSALKGEVIALKRKRIVDAARRLFYEKGYERTTLDDIADRLEVTKQFIYSYYKNKTELLHEISLQCIRECLKTQSRILAGKLPLPEKLARIADEVAQVIITYQAHTIIYLREEMNLDPEIARTIREERNEFDHRIMNLLKEGMRRGDFEVIDERITARCIGGMLVWCALWYRDLGVLAPAAIGQLISQNVMRMVGHQEHKPSKRK